MKPKVINGYDGTNGVHSNLVWNVDAGWCAYTLYNKVIIEHIKTRNQKVVA